MKKRLVGVNTSSKRENKKPPKMLLAAYALEHYVLVSSVQQVDNDKAYPYYCYD